MHQQHKKKTPLFLIGFCLLMLLLFPASVFSQNGIDTIGRKTPLRGNFRWILSNEMYEEGAIIDNLKTGEWLKYYKGELSGKTVYNKGLAISEFWNYNSEMKPRYFLSPEMDTLTINYYNLEGKLTRVVKNVIEIKTAALNYSLLSDDSLFQKKAVTEINIQYTFWAHRNDVVVLTETTGEISNKKYFVNENGKQRLLFETNDKGDFIFGKKKDFLKEEEKSRKFSESKVSSGTK